jgi:hypothetical protein
MDALKQLAGKTIVAAAIAYDGGDELVIRFSDETFLIIEAKRSYGDDAELDLELTDLENRDLQYRFHLQHQLGLITEEQAHDLSEAYVRRRNIELMEQREMLEHKKYLQLKAKFEGR